MSPEERRDKLVDVTLSLLREHGRAVTTRQIAEAAGVAEGTIFRVVESKEELVDLAIARAFEPGALVDRIEEIDPDQDLRDRLVALAAILQQRFRATFELMKTVGMVRPSDHVHDSPEAIARHQIMKAKLDGFINPQSAIVTYAEADRSYPARYARAIAYYQLREPDKSLKLIDALLEEQPENPYLWELKGQVLSEFGRAKEAEAPQRRSVQLKPEAPLLRINLGQTLISLDDRAKIEEGVSELKRSLTLEEDNAEAWRQLAQAYDKLGQEGLARLATAEYDFEIGDVTQARIFAMRAREKLPKNTPEWRRATDIVLVSKPSQEDLRELAREGSSSRNP